MARLKANTVSVEFDTTEPCKCVIRGVIHFYRACWPEFWRQKFARRRSHTRDHSSAVDNVGLIATFAAAVQIGQPEVGWHRHWDIVETMGQVKIEVKILHMSDIASGRYAANFECEGKLKSY